MGGLWDEGVRWEIKEHNKYLRMRLEIVKHNVIRDVRTYFVEVTVKLSRFRFHGLQLPSVYICFLLCTCVSITECVDKCKMPKAMPA